MGPTTVSPPGAISPETLMEAVVIACQSSGHVNPAEGRQWNPLTTTLLAV